MDRTEPVLRVATPEDAPAIDALMKASAAALFPAYYDERQVASAVEHVAQADQLLLADGTFFVLEASGEPVACGGWTRRDRLYTGSGTFADEGRILDHESEPARIRAMFVRADWTRHGLGRRIIEESEDAARREGYRRLALLATLAGVPLYLACGFEPIEDVEVVLTDGVVVRCVSMAKPIDPRRGAVTLQVAGRAGAEAGTA
jgi:GNAT superfamily N-acetyltransferase